MDEREALWRVERLQAAYVRCLDQDRLEDWPGFFADDCFYQIVHAANAERGLPMGLIYADSQGMLRDRVAALRQANIYEPQRYRHLVSATVILDAGRPSRVEAESNLLVVRSLQAGASEVFAVGLYRDVIDLTGPEAKFREKRVVLDNDRVDTLLAIPL
ncbi:MAG: aromatic-ring-hydroxylating dioxygenase subunit beta [Alphaproteobacteria bacterium]|nr:aromatic-ring-hydroxylating dioxygenase subunit beta [Alphaproteobacteria bacterium]MCB9930723.1 aromatic-ring-hydroxylating dioxygenase subunit beta [Alphaproteobacteria bacterium]